MPSSEVLNAALSYAARGWPVFPLRGKKPFKDTHGFKDATTDPDIIVEWWDRWPDANVGIACGKKSFDVVDIDGPKGELALVAWLQDKGIFEDAKNVLNSTPISITAKGKHLLFKPSGKLRNLVRAAEDIDIRTDGGYIVVPPSIHPDTKQPYSWAEGHQPDDIELANLPDWMVEYLKTGPKSKSQSLFSDEVIIIKEGERNQILFKQGASARSRGQGRDAIEAALFALNRSQCRPPLPDHEVLRIVESVMEYAPGGANDAIKPTESTTVETDSASDSIQLSDLCYETDNGWKFSPAMAVDFFLSEKLTLRMSKSEPEIFIFDGRVYKPEGDRQIDRMICNTVGDRANNRTIQEVTRRIKNELLEDPVEFDPDPFLLGIRNGVADLNTGKVRAYCPEDLITDMIDVEYDPTAKCPVFLKFLESSAPHISDRLTLIDWFVATAIREPLPYVLFLLGLGRNGKGIYEKLIKRFFGEKNFRDMALAEVARNNFAAGEFYKKRGWIASEQSGKKKTTIGTDFMKLTSGDGTIDSDRKNKTRIQFKPFFQTIVDTNAMPKIEDTSVGWMERFIKVDLPFIFVMNPDPENPVEKKRDPHMYRQMATDGELSGILNLILWRAPDIAKSMSIHKRSSCQMFAEYAVQSSSVSSFCDAFCEYDANLLSVRIPTKDIYTIYHQWCSALVGEVVDEAYFGRYLKRFCDGRSSVRGKDADGKNYTTYPGLMFDKEAAIETIESMLIDFSGSRKYSQVDLKYKYSNMDNPTTISHVSHEELWKSILKRFGSLDSAYREEFYQTGVLPEIHEKTTTGDGEIEDATREIPEIAREVHENIDKVPIDQLISELERKEEIAKPATLAEEYHIPELDVCEMLDKRGWIEGRRGFWNPPARRMEF